MGKIWVDLIFVHIILIRCVKCKETLFDHPYPWTTQHLPRTIYNIVNEEKYKIYYNGEKLKQIEATKRRHTARAHIKSHKWRWQCYHANILNPSIKFGAKLTGQQHPKKTQRAAITSYPNPHHPLQGWDQEMSTGEAHTHQKRTEIQCHNG